ncbi:MAG: ARPP-1 family domain-containing protein [Flammeovirgaceae bacterium]
MKPTILIIAILSIFSPAFAQFTYEHLEVDYAGAYQFKNLKIIPIRAKPSFAQANQQAASLNNALSLRQALATNQAAIMEHTNDRGRIRENVNILTFENFSDQPIFLMSGEVITGGMQDRVIARDMVIQPRSGRVDVPVFCVEKGRWTSGTKKNKFKNYHEASMHLRQVIDRENNQSAVWKEIAKENRRDRIRSSTQAYTAHANSPEYIRRENEYLTFFNEKFMNKENIVGIVGVTGGVVMGCDIFASPDLFYREYNNLIYAYIDEALTFGIAITMTDEEVKRYMDNLLTNSVMQERFVRQNGKMFKQGEQIIHITTY